jgi:uncharacterized protein
VAFGKREARGGGRRKRALRIYFATDVHGSDACFRKFLAAAKVYEPDVLILGGDFAGKGLVPVLTSDGVLTAWVENEQVTTDADGWDQLAKDINKRGFYPVRMTEGERDRLRGDPAALDQLFRAEICAQMRGWCELAAERLDPQIRCIITPGNDDPVEADAVIKASARVDCPEFELYDLGPSLLVSVGTVPFTPWATERESSEEDLGKQLTELLEQVPSGKGCVLNAHCPPYASGLDEAPELDATLKPMIRGGRPSIVPVGSKAVREAIRRFQPAVALHGHIHESRGAQKIGRTLCVNPGSEYSQGVLRGAVVDIAEDGSCLDFLLTTG